VVTALTHADAAADFDIDIGDVSEIDASAELGAAMPDDDELLPRVKDVLARIADKDERRRFERFFATASAAIKLLNELRVFVVQDPDVSDETNWARAQIDFQRSLAYTRAFLDLVAQDFPRDASDETLDVDSAVDDAFDFEENAGPSPRKALPQGKAAERAHEIAGLFAGISADMRRELLNLEQLITSEARTAQRWQLFERLGEFRGRSRSAIGEMVFLAARLFAVVRREDVVPYYREYVHASLTLRRHIADLRLAFEIQTLRFQARLRSGESLVPVVAGVHAEVDGFMAKDAYKTMRAGDKQAFFEARRALYELVQAAAPSRRAIEEAIEGVARFVESLHVINRREVLVVHDQNALTLLEHHLDTALAGVCESDVARARAGLRGALAAGDLLYGREPSFDEVVGALNRLAQQTTFDAVTLEECVRLLRLLGQNLARLKQTF
jgi:hypothetical protein